MSFIPYLNVLILNAEIGTHGTHTHTQGEYVHMDIKMINKDEDFTLILDTISGYNKAFYVFKSYTYHTNLWRYKHL